LATKSEGVGLIVRAIGFQDFQHRPMWSWSTNVTDTDRRWTDIRTSCNRTIPRYMHSASCSKHCRLALSFALHVDECGLEERFESRNSGCKNTYTYSAPPDI